MVMATRITPVLDSPRLQDLLKIAILLPQELKACQPPLSLDLAGQYKSSSKYIADEHSMDHVSLVFGSSKGYLLVFFQ
jgi:hypothetical protein